MTIKINGEYFILWRAVDADGYELDVYLQKRRNKKSAIRLFNSVIGVLPCACK
jgi:putative transposase